MRVGELYRIAKSSSVLGDFVVEVRRLLSKLCKQNFNKAILINNVKKFITSIGLLVYINFGLIYLLTSFMIFSDLL